MGIYDRDYYQEPEPRFAFRAPRTMVVTLVLINVAVFVIDWLSGGKLTNFGALPSDVLRRPWDYWQLLSAGFLHDQTSILHLGFNMFVLWMFGREVEAVYGRWEFLRMYLVFLVLASLAWVITTSLWDARTAGGDAIPMVGASGAITGILVVFVMNFPRQTILLFGVIPMPAWLMLVMFVLGDLVAFSGGPGSERNTAFAAHLGGALCGLVYYRSGINFGRLLPQGMRMPNLPARRLRLHDPDEQDRQLNREVDAILEKIHQQGEASLTKKERRTLESASRRFQQRRR